MIKKKKKFKKDRGLSLVAQSVESACNTGDLGSIPGSGRLSGEGHGNPLQCSCLENPMEPGRLQSMGPQESDTTEWLSTHRGQLSVSFDFELHIFLLISDYTLFISYILIIYTFSYYQKNPQKPIIDLTVLCVLSFFGDYSELGIHIQISSQMAHNLLQKELD